MASLRNAIKSQKIHKERHQPLIREHLGPLEKKKDYRKRARCQQEKKNILKKLHKKAISRNPDEFHFHMINSEVKDGVHFEKVKDEEIAVADVKQDLIYITHRRSTEKKKIEKLKAQLHLLGPSVTEEGFPQNKHILFLDTNKEAENADVVKLLDTHSSMIDRPFNRLRTCQLANMKIKSQETEELKEIMKERSKAYKELIRRIERENKLRILQDKLEVRKRLVDRKNKNEPMPVLIKEGTKDSAPVYKWLQERKK